MREEERNINVWLSLERPLLGGGGSGLQPRHVPWLCIKPATLCSQASTQSPEPHQPGPKGAILDRSYSPFYPALGTPALFLHKMRRGSHSLPPCPPVTAGPPPPAQAHGFPSPPPETSCDSLDYMMAWHPISLGTVCVFCNIFVQDTVEEIKTPKFHNVACIPFEWKPSLRSSKINKRVLNK